MADQNEEEEKIEKPIVAKSAMDLQRLKLQKLMKNPDKPVIIPNRPKEKNSHSVPEFVRNVMGSSAGAGSGEFHVYRHLRRREYSRQKFIQEKGKKELLDLEHEQKLEENKRKAEEITAKKRAKRLKKKEKMKNRKKVKSEIKGKEIKEEKSEERESEKDEESSDEENNKSDTDISTKNKQEEASKEDQSENKNNNSV